MSNKKLNPIVAERLNRHQTDHDHGAPVTRRDFLRAGLLKGAACFAMPSALGLLASRAQAADGLSIPPAYIEINCAGGAGFHANSTMLDAGGRLLPSYNLCGQGSLSVAQQNIVRVFGNQAYMFKNSGLYKGLMSVAGNAPDVFAQSAMINLATFTGADTGTNPMSAFGLVQSSIASGKYLPNLQTYLNFNLPAYVSPPSPIVVSSVESLYDVARPRSGDSLAQFQKSTQISLLKYLKALNDAQIGRYTSRPGGSDLKSSIEMAQQKVAGLWGDDSVSFDPRTDEAFKQIWGAAWDPNSKTLIDPALQFSESAPEVVNRNLNESLIVHSLAKGYANTGGIFRFGFDYHNNPRNATDAQDAEIGQLIGRILLSFRATGRPVFIYITTDGTVTAPASDQGGNSWQGDSAVNTVNMLFAYRPGKGVQVTTNGGSPATQIGHFTSGQISDLTHPVASARGSAAAAFVNYLNFAGIDAESSPFTKVTTLTQDVLKQLSVIKYV